MSTSKCRCGLLVLSISRLRLSWMLTRPGDYSWDSTSVRNTDPGPLCLPPTLNLFLYMLNTDTGHSNLRSFSSSASTKRPKMVMRYLGLRKPPKSSLDPPVAGWFEKYLQQVMPRSRWLIWQPGVAQNGGRRELKILAQRWSCHLPRLNSLPTWVYDTACGGWHLRSPYIEINRVSLSLQSPCSCLGRAESCV